MTQSLEDSIKQSAQAVFASLGTGHSEYIYHRAMEIECQYQGWKYESKKIIPIVYRNHTIGYGEADLVVWNGEHVVVCEFKAISSELREIEISQVKNYLKSCSPQSIGLLLNFPQPGGNRKARDHIDILHVYPDTDQEEKKEGQIVSGPASESPSESPSGSASKVKFESS